MTKKHYVRFAKIFNGMLDKATNGSNRLLTRDDMINCIALCADIMADDNPAFDREQFFKACGYTKGSTALPTGQKCPNCNGIMESIPAYSRPACYTTLR